MNAENRRFWRGGIKGTAFGAIVGGILGQLCDYVPLGWLEGPVWDDLVTWIIGTAELALFGAVLGFVCGLVITISRSK
jgi:hypothetical protein